MRLLHDFLIRKINGFSSIGKNKESQETSRQQFELKTVNENSSMTSPISSEIALSSFLASTVIQKKQLAEKEITKAFKKTDTYQYYKKHTNYSEDELNKKIEDATKPILKCIKADTDIKKFVETIKTAIKYETINLIFISQIEKITNFLNSNDGLEELSYLLKIAKDKEKIINMIDFEKITPNEVKSFRSRYQVYDKMLCFELGKKIKISGETYDRLQKNPELLRKKYDYASDNDDINNLYLKTENMSEYGLKKLESAIKKHCDNDPQKIKELSESLYPAANVISDLSHSFFINLENIDLEFTAQYGNEIVSKFKGDEGYGFKLEDIFNSVNKNNKCIIEDLLSLENIDMRSFLHSLKYCDNPEKAEEIKKMTEDIKNGKSSILELPFAKYAKKDEDILKLKNTQTRTFADGTSLEKIVKNTKQGETVFVGEKTYINDKGQMSEIKIKPDMFKKLFPPYETQIMQQGNHTTNCVFLSHDIIAYERNDFARPELFKIFKQDGDDIIVTFPTYPDYPVRFKNGEPIKTDKEWQVANTSKGNQILEQAMLQVLYACENNINSANQVLFIDAMKNPPDNVSYCDIIIPPEKQGTKYLKKEMMPALEKYSGKDGVLLCAFTTPRFNDEDYYESKDYNLISGHAYYIKDSDPTKKKVTLVNPFNSLYTIELSYDMFQKYFARLHVTDLNK